MNVDTFSQTAETSEIKRRRKIVQFMSFL